MLLHSNNLGGLKEIAFAGAAFRRPLIPATSGIQQHCEVLHRIPRYPVRGERQHPPF
jgi:hypothetical protein